VVNVEYFIVSLATLVVAIYVIYMIANKIFNIQLRTKPLILCACCSLFISTVLPQMVIGFAGIPGTIVVLILCALLFSYLIASHSDSEVLAEPAIKSTAAIPEQQRELNASIPEELCPVIEKIIEPKPIMLNQKNSLSENREQQPDEQETLILEYNSDEIEAITWTEILREQPVSSITIQGQEDCKSERPIKTELKSDLAETQPCKTEAKLEFVADDDSALQSGMNRELEIEPKPSLLSINVDQSNSKVLNPIISIQEEAAAQPEIALTPLTPLDLALQSTVKNKLEPRLLPLGTAQSEFVVPFVPEAKDQAQIDDALLESEPMLTDSNTFESLDDLLDYAFTQKDALQLTAALKAFQKALLLCKEKDVAPLIIVEIGNIFKARGQYDEAVQLFSEGRNSPYLLNNSVLNQQFIEMIAFLRIIRNNLLENRIGFIPYDKIPSDLMLKINEEFRDWLTLSCTKPQTGRIIKE
jgi:tetratricopeptide (TPR) repeat protein